jgi:putative transposase
VTICCREKNPVFENQAYATKAWDYLKKQLKINDGDLSAIVLLPDHLHIIIDFFEGNNQPLGVRISEIKKRITWAIRKAGWQGKRLWQKNYYEHIIRNEKDWYEKVNYMRNNPVMKGLVEEADEWRYWWTVGYDNPLDENQTGG